MRHKDLKVAILNSRITWSTLRLGHPDGIASVRVNINRRHVTRCTRRPCIFVKYVVLHVRGKRCILAVERRTDTDGATQPCRVFRRRGRANRIVNIGGRDTNTGPVDRTLNLQSIFPALHNGKGATCAARRHTTCYFAERACSERHKAYFAHLRVCKRARVWYV